MSEASDQLLRGFQAQERRFVERRFPLRFEPESPAHPRAVQPGQGPRAGTRRRTSRGTGSTRRATPPEVREAARLTWSRRAWGDVSRARREHGAPHPPLPRVRRRGHGREALPLVPARRGGQAPRGLLSVRRAPRRLPARSRRTRRSRSASNHPFAQMALDPDLPVEAFVAALGVPRRPARPEPLPEPPPAQPRRGGPPGPAAHRGRQAAPRRCSRGRSSATACPRLDAGGRAAVATAVRDMLERVILRRLSQHVAPPRGGARRAGWLAAEAGHRPARPRRVDRRRRRAASLRATVAQVRERLAALEVDLPRRRRTPSWAACESASGDLRDAARAEAPRDGAPRQQSPRRPHERRIWPRSRYPLPLAPGHARRLGAVAAREDARVGPADGHPVGRAPPGALHARADAGRAPVLEPADVGRVRRHLGEPGAAPALLPREPPPRPPLLLHHAHPGGRPPRRGLVADGRAPRRLLPAAAESAHG